MSTLEHLNQLLPQTQCRECGFMGCLPYAEALLSEDTAINLCAPGGEAVMQDIAQLLQRAPLAPAKAHTPALAWIDEAVCIGCTACIRACPVDAIMGASKYMHTVLAEECTGCGLCVAPCPVDCIEMRPVEQAYLPQARHWAEAGQTARFAAASHAQARYEWHEARLARDVAEKRAQLAEREAATKARLQASRSQSAFNPADLIAQAMARASAQQAQRAVPANRTLFQEQQIKEAQQRATFRRAQRDAKYGNEAEKAAAIEWLRAYKAAQEAAEQEKQQG